jgi:hypothetical protein
LISLYLRASYSSNNKPNHHQQQRQNQQSDESVESPENDNYSGISVDTKPIVSTASISKKWTTTSEYRCFRSQLPQQQQQQQTFKPVGSVITTKQNNHHSPPSINEYIDEDQVEEASSDSTTNTGTNSSCDNTNTNLFKWPAAAKTKAQLISNETISMDVDDEKIEGILV